MADAVARAWLTGTPEEPIINLDLPAGPKGEPGGWNVGTNLGTTDLDTVMTAGLYWQASTGGALAVANHYPPMKDMAGSVRGVLQVTSWSGGTAVIQRFTRIGSGAASTVQRPRVTYERYRESAWSEWSVVTSAQTTSDAIGFRTQQVWDEQVNAWADISGPGGWTHGSDLATNDLNTITTPGLYRQTNSAAITLVRNYPEAGRVGTLSVEARIAAGVEYGPSVVQTFTPYFGIPAAESRIFFKRTLTGMTWQPWRVFSSQRVDNTAGRVIYTWDDTANREQLIYGDSGWRNIDTLLSTNFIPQTSSGRVAIRRVGSTVNLVLRVQASDALVAKNLAKNSLQTLLDIPVGFQEYPSSYGAAMVCTAMLGSYMEVLALGAVNANSQLKIMGSTTQVWRSAEIISANISWSTNDPWPTTLPGAALGSIPNL